MGETTFNIRFRRELERLGVLFYRIESHATCPGIPDNYYMTKWGLSSGWLEMKQAREKPRAIAYRPAQVPWLLDFSRKGGKCFTILGVEATREISVIPGDQSLIASGDLRLAACRTFREDLEPWSGIEDLLRIGWWTVPRPERAVTGGAC